MTLIFFQDNLHSYQALYNVRVGETHTKKVDSIAFLHGVDGNYTAIHIWNNLDHSLGLKLYLLFFFSPDSFVLLCPISLPF